MSFSLEKVRLPNGLAPFVFGVFFLGVVIIALAFRTISTNTFQSPTTQGDEILGYVLVGVLSVVGVGGFREENRIWH